MAQAATKKRKLTANNKPRCFRVTGIPANFSELDVLNALQECEPSLQIREQNISLYPAYCGDTQTALLNLETQYCEGLVQRLVQKEPFHFNIGEDVNLTIDSEFYSLTPLNTPGDVIIADVVAVTGLAGHAFGSWRNRDTYCMWLKDFLPKDVQGLRVMTYGYNSKLIGDTAESRMLDYRRQFIQTLLNARRGAEERPIIFIGHSMGGLLILQALLQCKNRDQHQQIFSATNAIIFFGTPHGGMEIEELCSMVENKSPLATTKKEVLQQLGEGSNFLDTQRDDITHLWDSKSQIEILSFYEIKKTRAVEESGTRSGGMIDMVRKNNAQLFWPSEQSIPAPYNHTDIVKFGRDSDTYQTVVTHMTKWKSNIVARGERIKNDYKRALTDENWELINWLYPNDTGNRHNEIRQQRKEGTGQWFIENEIFCEWVEGLHDFVWAHGIPGAGKTFISSFMIDHLQKHATNRNYGIAHVYLNYKEQQKQGPTDVLLSLVKQLACQHRTIPESLLDVFTECTRENRKPRLDELETILASLAKEFTRTFIIFDALDEGDRETQRRPLFCSILPRMKDCGIKLLCTSRRFADDIEEFFQDTPTIEIRAHQEDIKSYIYEKLDAYPSTKRMIKNSKREEEIISKLIEASDGMFLFVSLNIGYLCMQPTIKHLRKAVDGLKDASSSSEKGSTINLTYDRIIEVIKAQPESRRMLAFKALSWLTYARRTLSIKELQVAVTIEPGTSELDEELLPEKLLLVDICFGLVAVDETSGTVRLAHFTVQQYLNAIQNVVFLEAESSLAIACITYLTYDIFKTGACASAEEYQSRLESHPFLHYIAKNIAFHISSSDERVTIESLGKLLASDGNISSYFQLEYNLYYSSHYQKGCQAQHLAAFFGHEVAMRQLITQGVEINLTNRTKKTPLHLAIRRDRGRVVRLLIDNGANIEAIDIDGKAPLHKAARWGSKAVVQFLIDCGANIVATDKDGKTPLHKAARRRSEAVVQLLIDCGANIEATSNIDGETPLHEAARYGNKAAAQLLVDCGANIMATDKNGKTPLHEAAQRGSESVVQLLIDRGTNIEAIDKDGKTPLHAAARWGSKAVVQLLIDCGANIVAAFGKDGKTPLHEAARHGNKAVVQLLIDCGANIEVTGIDEKTPLHEAAQRGSEPVVQLLIDCGANIEAIEIDGRTPVHEAARSSSKAVFQLLIDSGANIEAADRVGETPLHKIGRWGSKVVGQLLVDCGANIEATDQYGRTPLHNAARWGSKAVVQLLIDCGANIVATDIDGETPLHEAAQSSKAVAHLLINCGANIEAASAKDGKTPLHKAVQYRNKAVIQLLVDCGANIAATDKDGKTPLHQAYGNEAIVQMFIDLGANSGYS